MDQRQAAIYYLNQRMFGRAEKYLQEWVMAHPDDMYIHMELIWCFYSRNSEIGWNECDSFYENIYCKPNMLAIKHFVRAEQLVYEDKEEDSLAHYKIAIKEGLDVPVLHHCLGIALKAIRRKEEAMIEYKIALSQDALFLPSMNDYGHMLFDEGRFDRVESILQPLNEIEFNIFDLQFKNASKDIKDMVSLRKACMTLCLSIKLRYDNKVNEAAKTLWPVFRIYTDNCWFVRAMMYLFYKMDGFNFSRKRIEDVIKKETPIYCYVAGLMYWYEDKYQEALQSYDEAISKGLDNPLVLCARSLVYKQLEKCSEQEQDLQSVLSCAPWLIYAREDLAVLKYGQGLFSEVEQLVNITSEEYDLAVNYDISGKFSLATLEAVGLSSLLKQGKIKDALFEVKNQRIPCEDEHLLFDRAMVYAENCDYHNAALELTKAIKIDYNVIAYFAGNSNVDNKTRLQHLIQKEPNCFGAALASSILYAFEGCHEKAKDCLMMLIQSFPDETEAWYHLANMCIIFKDKLQAKDLYQKAFQLNHGNKNAISSFCMILHENGDINDLWKLSKELKVSTVPLEYALDLAEKSKNLKLVREISSEILSIDPKNIIARIRLLTGLDPNSLEYARAAKPLIDSMTFEFERRAIVARTLFSNGEPEEAAKEYDTLFVDGYNSVHDILIYGLAYISTLSVNNACNKKK